MKRALFHFAAFISLASASMPARAQHLWWDLENQTNATCLYGEINVLASYPAIYYCGANWHPGEPAGGYCGIQDNCLTERRTIFSIWDTSPALHPSVTEADARTKFGRFGGEGEGGHTHMLWPWKTGQTFRFFVQKQPGADKSTTDARYYIFDPARNRWVPSATINSPNGDKPSVATIGGGLNSFLENFLGRDKDRPRLALYRLWVGPGIGAIKCLTRARGDGTWGTFGDAYFLAAGDRAKLDEVFAELAANYGKPAFGGKSVKLDPISDKPLPPELLSALGSLPRAAAIAPQ